MKRFLVVSALFFAVFAVVHAQSQDVTVTSLNGTERDIFTNKEDIYIGGDCSYASDQWVEVFVVGNRSNWRDGIELIDKSDHVERIKIASDGDIPHKRVWGAKTTVGTYDIVLDADGDDHFDEGEDCVTSGSFKIIISGDGSVSEGSKNPDEDIKWKTTKDDPEISMLQVRLHATSDEDLHIDALELTPSGTGNDRSNIAQVLVVEDRNNNGLYNYNSDPVWAQDTYSHDNTKKEIDTDVILEAGKTKNILLVYVMGKDIGNADTFLVSLTNVFATGLISDKKIRFDDVPINSVKLIARESGDALPSKALEDPESPVLTQPQTNNSKTAESLVTKNSSDLFGNIFKDDKENTEEDSGDKIVPMWLRVGLFIIIVLIALVIAIKTLRFVLWFILSSIQRLKND